MHNIKIRIAFMTILLISKFSIAPAQSLYRLKKNKHNYYIGILYTGLQEKPVQSIYIELVKPGQHIKYSDDNSDNQLSRKYITSYDEFLLTNKFIRNNFSDSKIISNNHNFDTDLKKSILIVTYQDSIDIKRVVFNSNQKRICVDFLLKLSTWAAHENKLSSQYRSEIIQQIEYIKEYINNIY